MYLSCMQKNEICQKKGRKWFEVGTNAKLLFFDIFLFISTNVQNLTEYYGIT